MDILEKIVDSKKAGKPLVVATVVDAKGSTPREIGAKMIIRQNGAIAGTVGGGAIEKAVVDEALTLFKSGEAKIMHYDLGDLHMQCGGKMSVFFEPVLPNPQLFIFGAGHIGRALSTIAAILNYRITVIDNRPEFANNERFPAAQNIIVENYSKSLDALHFDQNSYIVIVTHKHLHDEVVLQNCIDHPFKYLGMIGSRSKVQKALAQLKERNVADAVIRQIHAPIGLNIGANTPEEIAVAIIAEMTAVRNGADISSLSMRGVND